MAFKLYAPDCVIRALTTLRISLWALLVIASPYFKSLLGFGILKFAIVVPSTIFIGSWTLEPFLLALPAMVFSFWLPHPLVLALAICTSRFLVWSPLDALLASSALSIGFCLHQVSKSQRCENDISTPNVEASSENPTEIENPKPKRMSLCTEKEHLLLCGHILSKEGLAYPEVCSKKCKSALSDELRDPPPKCLQCKPASCGARGHLFPCGHFVRGHFLGEQWFMGLILEGPIGSRQLTCTVSCVNPLETCRLDAEPNCPCCENWDKEDRVLEIVNSDLSQAYREWGAAAFDNKQDGVFSQADLKTYILEQEKAARDEVGWEVWREYQTKGPVLFHRHINRRDAILASKEDHGINRAIAKPRAITRLLGDATPQFESTIVSPNARQESLEMTARAGRMESAKVATVVVDLTKMTCDQIDILPGCQPSSPRGKINEKSLMYILELRRRRSSRQVSMERTKLIGVSISAKLRGIEETTEVRRAINMNACAHRLVRYAACSLRSLKTIQKYSKRLKKRLVAMGTNEFDELESQLPGDADSIRERLFILYACDELRYSPIMKVPWQRWLDFTHHSLTATQLQQLEAEVRAKDPCLWML